MPARPPFLPAPAPRPSPQTSLARLLVAAGVLAASPSAMAIPYTVAEGNVLELEGTAFSASCGARDFEIDVQFTPDSPPDTSYVITPAALTEYVHFSSQLRRVDWIENFPRADVVLTTSAGEIVRIRGTGVAVDNELQAWLDSDDIGYWAPVEGWYPVAYLDSLSFGGPEEWWDASEGVTVYLGYMLGSRDVDFLAADYTMTTMPGGTRVWWRLAEAPGCEWYGTVDFARLASGPEGTHPSDDDGVRSVDDNCFSVPNPDQSDVDGDGYGDACDDDIDGDGWDNDADPCPTTNEADADADGCPDDADGDGVWDLDDRCPSGDDTVDVDQDGTPDACDICPDDALNDQDSDGLCTLDDACPLDNDDQGADTDGDTVCNSDDVCHEPLSEHDNTGWLGGDSDDLLDLDDDGIPDGCDLCVDSNGDEVCGSEDTCFYAGRGGDADLDGECDDTDPCPLDYADDSDGDGACDSDDICPGLDDLLNTDGDALVDCRDACPADVENDGDGDGLCESWDNCEGVSNHEQADADADGIGDACDPDGGGGGALDDEDDDGVPDGLDRCPATPDLAAVSPEGCGLAQTCAPDQDWKNHGAYVECVERAATLLYEARVLSGAERQASITAAARSDVGRRKKDKDRDHRGHGHSGRDERCDG